MVYLKIAIYRKKIHSEASKLHSSPLHVSIFYLNDTLQHLRVSNKQLSIQLLLNYQVNILRVNLTIVTE